MLDKLTSSAESNNITFYLNILNSAISTGSNIVPVDFQKRAESFYVYLLFAFVDQQYGHQTGTYRRS